MGLFFELWRAKFRPKHLAAATLRPETMYGQTNAWVLPNGRYGAFEVNETDVFILTQRAARNLAYQGFFRIPEKPSCFIELTDCTDHQFGDKAAEKVCGDLKIKSQNEKEKLAEAKRESEKHVVSRSGDECVVAQTEQWYIFYGEAEWKTLAEECLSSMNLYSDVTQHGFEHTLSWLNQWACSRSFGLGTRIPWDEKYLVESLSDSTLYMAYYTIAHFLHDGDMYGDSTTSGVIPEQMTDECLVRISSRIILTFCIYNHTTIMLKKHWPRGYRCNGHLMLNSKKMSKSTGNFLTLRLAIEEYSADATRMAADAGDGVDDANFVFDTANAAIG
ncbi:hypothetical protein PRUPE_4G275400 [Prunus persica]|uniref:Methionyl/Leucyl tRNA synthetase domain-containing protein n=1 Tax=Prunus persica TaxID=3760 RepID=M5WYL2_PRUPE|nr:hypothetical protein PRUPE_4G275400 [Prunus persica]